MRGQVGGKFSPCGVGKTTHEVGTCLALVTGRALLGQTVRGGPKCAWLWNLEDSTEELSRTIQATCKHWGITAHDVGDCLFVDSALDGAMLNVATQTSSGGVTINAPLVDALITEIRARGIDYLSINPFISSHSVDEDDNGAIDAVVSAGCTSLSRRTVPSPSRTTSKNSATSKLIESARDASSLVAACRSALVLNRMSSEEAEGRAIPGEDRR
jgi:hypothetical protein